MARAPPDPFRIVRPLNRTNNPVVRVTCLAKFVSIFARPYFTDSGTHGELRWSDPTGVAARVDGDKCGRSTAPVGDLGGHT